MVGWERGPGMMVGDGRDMHLHIGVEKIGGGSRKLPPLLAKVKDRPATSLSPSIIAITSDGCPMYAARYGMVVQTI